MDKELAVTAGTDLSLAFSANVSDSTSFCL